MVHEVTELLGIDADWDGSHSHPVNRKNLAKLLRVLLDLGAQTVPPPDLLPYGSGGAVAEWHFAEKRIEVGIASDGEIFAFVTNANGDYVVELEDTWFIPSDKLAALRQYLKIYAQR